MLDKRYQAQMDQAETFSLGNQQAMIDLETRLVLMAAHLVNQVAIQVLPSADVLQLQQFVACRKLSELYSSLRSRAGDFCVKGMSGFYWVWIDAVSAYSDSRSARWPYMTPERRRINLDEASRLTIEMERVIA